MSNRKMDFLIVKQAIPCGLSTIVVCISQRLRMAYLNRTNTSTTRFFERKKLRDRTKLCQIYNLLEDQSNLWSNLKENSYMHLSSQPWYKKLAH